MGQFKPMPKMETTEPSVILKLKKGGTVRKADGGALPIRATSGRIAGAAAPMQAAEMAKARGRSALLNAAALSRPQAPIPAQAMGRVKKGGVMKKAEGGESRAEHAAEMKKISRLESEIKSHEAKPASKGHKGLKTGGVANAQGGYKKGGKACMANGGPTAAELEKLSPGSLTPATRDMAEKVRTESTVYPSALKDLGPQPTNRELQLLRESAADAKAAREAERMYNEASSGRKTGGVVKKYATGGVVKGGPAGYKAGGKCMSAGGFTEMKKMKSW